MTSTGGRAACYNIGHWLMTTSLNLHKGRTFKRHATMGSLLFIPIVELFKSAWRIIIFFVKWKLWFSYYTRLLPWQHNSHRKKQIQSSATIKYQALDYRILTVTTRNNSWNDSWGRGGFSRPRLEDQDWPWKSRPRSFTEWPLRISSLYQFKCKIPPFALFSIFLFFILIFLHLSQQPLQDV